ncbi:epsin-2-like isoform X3 [Scyliorhinus canicula]|nr:epsin-2-like isoform X3 [Scyliorhinus canicula]XP_038633340.1 epsin-2-like isoform X3 [Scyliorhinus canicula]XP_038633341.1 epsin-2-like isoform X3 [Scyliorhinus canicula]XP_038633342.1 epsin-2-like isoform X3 [Scyliorhinus canicula]
MATSAIRRQMKNIVHNYSDAEVKVREATSNDPWGPPSSLMSNIADLTFNVVAFSEIMGMVWKRLNDHGKNWRHVYKALTLLDYLIKTGSEKVSQQCKENIYTVQTLKDFQYIDRDGKDQGINVRERAKQLVALLKDEERLRQERAHALKTKERMSQVTTGLGSNQQPTFGRGSSHPNLSLYSQGEEFRKSRAGSPVSLNESSSSSPRFNPDLEQARPHTSGEEELQLQLALAMSREEAEKATQQPSTESDEEIQLQIALSLSKEENEKELRVRSSLDEDDEEADENLQRALEQSRKENEFAEGRNESSMHELADIFGAPVTVTETRADPWDTCPQPWRSRNMASPPSTACPELWSTLGTNASNPSAATSWPSLDTNAAASPQMWDTDLWAQPSGPTATTQSNVDPWVTVSTTNTCSVLPESSTFDPFTNPGNSVLDQFAESAWVHSAPALSDSPAGKMDLLGETIPNTKQNGSSSPDVFDMIEVGHSLKDSSNGPHRTPELFLDPNAACLVNLDSLLSAPSHTLKSKNPFHTSGGLGSISTSNPFQHSQQNKLTLKQIQGNAGFDQPTLMGSATAGMGMASMPFIAPLPMASSCMSTTMTHPSTFSGLAQGAGMMPATRMAADISHHFGQPLVPVSKAAIMPQPTTSLNPFL